MGPVLLLVLLLPLQQPPGPGGIVLPAGGGEIRLQADELTYEESTGVYTGLGHVRIVRGRVTLTADEVRLNSRTQDVAASGHVEVTDGEDTLRAQKMVLNLRDQTGAILDGDIFVARDNTHIRGDRIEKLGERSYRVSHGSMTTCRCSSGSPSWALYADDVKMTYGEYTYARDFLFYVKGVPVFYLPYMAFPVKTEQESGLLNPRYVYSTRDGSEVFLPYYQAIAPWMDATLTPEYFSRRGAGADLEYRYSLSAETGGRAFARYFNEYALSGGRTRWEAALRHEERMGESTWAKADIHLYGDPAYQADFGEALEIASQQYSESQVAVGTSAWPASIAAEARYYQDFYSSAGMSSFTATTVQRLPRLSSNVFRWRIPGSPVFYDGRIFFDNFQTERETLGQRLYWAQGLSLPENILDIVQIVPWAGIISRGYLTETTTQVSFVPRASVLLSSKVYRVFGRTKHVLEPEISYVYVPRIGQDSLPIFDERDRVAAARTATATLNNFFVHHFTDGTFREVAQFNLTASYDAETRLPRGRGELEIKPIPFIYWKIVGDGDFAGGGSRTSRISSPSRTDGRTASP